MVRSARTTRGNGNNSMEREKRKKKKTKIKRGRQNPPWGIEIDIITKQFQEPKSPNPLIP